MSEVKRFYSEISGRECVYASDFDAAQSELSALREELVRMTEGRDGLRLALDEANKIIAWQRDEKPDLARLADAERRNADVEKRAADLIECLWGIELPGAGNPRLRKLRRALEALKPTESRTSE